MAKFAKGVDHRLPNIEGDEVVCLADQEIPKDKLDWFKKYKPTWIAGGKAKAIEEAPDNRAINPMSTKRK